jgi:hypothetical protein
MYRPQPKEEIKKRKRIFIYLIFLTISSLLWLLIKLNNVYTVKFPITINFFDPPKGIWFDDEYHHQRLDIELQTRGFVLLRVAVVFKKEQTINASLQSLSPRKINQNEYYVSAQSLKSFLASHFGLSSDEIILAENELRFRANPLSSKKVIVIPDLKIDYDQRFGPYKPALIEPDSVEVYAVKQVLDTLRFITTEKAFYKNVRNNLSDSLKLVFNHPSMSASKHKVSFFQSVEQFTETTMITDIEAHEGTSLLKIFPNQTTLYINVALKDFGKLNPADFQVELDTTGLAQRKPLLYLKVTKMPEAVQLVRLDPEAVEYLIPATR